MNRILKCCNFVLKLESTNLKSIGYGNENDKKNGGIITVRVCRSDECGASSGI